jgi:hypothetical protein
MSRLFCCGHNQLVDVHLHHNQLVYAHLHHARMHARRTAVIVLSIHHSKHAHTHTHTHKHTHSLTHTHTHTHSLILTRHTLHIQTSVIITTGATSLLSTETRRQQAIGVCASTRGGRFLLADLGLLVRHNPLPVCSHVHRTMTVCLS